MSESKGKIFKERIVQLIDPLVFNVSRLMGMLRLPLNEPTPRRIMNRVRAGYWRPKVKKMGKGVQIDSGFIVRSCVGLLEIGDFSYIDVNVHFEMSAPIRIGRYVHIAPNVYIQSGDEVIIGNYVAISNGSVIYAASNTYKTPDGREKEVLLSMSASAPESLQYVTRGPVIIEEFAFIGLMCSILPGVRIGRGAIIGAGAVVTKDIPAYAIAVGAPARVIGQRPIPPDELNRQPAEANREDRI